jgi:hypothetical protein
LSFVSISIIPPSSSNLSAPTTDWGALRRPQHAVCYGLRSSVN